MSSLPSTDRPLLGIALMAGFCVLAPLGDSLAKLLGASIPVLQLLLVRFVAQGVLMAPMAGARGSTRLTPRILWLVALRTALHIGGSA